MYLTSPDGPEARINILPRPIILSQVETNSTIHLPPMDAPGLRHPEPAKRFMTFLRDHRDAIPAMDLFTVLTLTSNPR